MNQITIETIRLAAQELSLASYGKHDWLTARILSDRVLEIVRRAEAEAK